ncbi:MAG TPA: hypothetical protein VGX68_18970 [Thermoanaerobaculia bacterium]|nr:hypothetical protein [Thermoanaerobaculia bacterium]
MKAREGATVVQQSLEHLRRDDGAELLRQFQVVGSAEELKKASDEFHGHAYSLMLLGSFLKNATDHHDIRRRREVLLLEEDVEHRSHAQKMFAAYVRHLGEDSPEVAVLRLLGFFDRTAERQLLDVLRAREAVAYEWPQEGWQLRNEKPGDEPPQSKRIDDSLAEVTAPLLDLPQSQWNRVLNRLRDLRLIDFTGPGRSPAVDAHPLLRECFAERVRTQFPAAWQAGHQRLFEHLSGTALYWPEGIEGLQPLYQAVAHGCLAGKHQQACDDVYYARILRGDVAYSGKKLGAIGADLGAVACFFTTPWTTLAPQFTPADQAWLLNEAAFSLRALGRLNDAVEPMQVSMEMDIESGEWNGAAISAQNVSELALTRGEMSSALTAGEQAITYADRSERTTRQIVSRTAVADVLHQAGHHAESQRLFEEAESFQAAAQSRYSQLYSLNGFRYSDLLLSKAEREAWQEWSAEMCSIFFCDTVIDRATRTLIWAEQNQASLLDIALNHLTLARAAWYKAHSASPIPNSAVHHIAAAVNGLRAAGAMHHLPRGLLTRAWMRCISGDEAGCRADLDEAWEIAERGPMPLFQADIHLYRARLLRDRAALAEARRLIEKHGYHRRDEELADAEEAAKGW